MCGVHISVICMHVYGLRAENASVLLPYSLLYSLKTRFLSEPVVRLTASRPSEPPITPPASSGEAKDMAIPGCLSGR